MPASPRSRNIRAIAGGVATSSSGAGGRVHANEKLSKIHDQRMRRAPYHDSASGEGPFPQDGVFGPVAPPAVALLAAVDMHEARDLAQLRVEAEDIARKAGQ